MDILPMRTTIILLFILNIGLIAQPFQTPIKISKLSGVNANPSATHTQSESNYLDSLLLTHADGEGILPIGIDSLTFTTNLSNYADVEQLADSNRFFTTSNGWLIVGDGDTTNSPSDSSMVIYDSAGASFELPINLTKDQGYELTVDLVEGETDLVSGWDFTSGWSNISASIIDNNSFSTAGYGGIYKTYSGLTQNDWVMLIIGGNTTSTAFDITTTAGGTFKLMPSTTGNFEYSEKFQWTNTTYNVFLRNQTAGTTNIDYMRLYQVDESQSVESSTITATYGNQTLFTSDTITSTTQSIDLRFIATTSNDTLKFVLSDSAKVKKSNLSLKSLNDYRRINYGDSIYVWYLKDISTVGTYNEKIYAHYNGKTDSTDVGYEVEASAYYVSNDGNDTNDGKTTLTPWKSLAKVNATTFMPGDSILFNKDDAWKGTLTASASGTLSQRIVYGSYGTGYNPVISNDTSITLNGWDDYSYGSATVYDTSAQSIGVTNTTSGSTNLMTFYKVTASATGTLSNYLIYSTGQSGVSIKCNLYTLSGTTLTEVPNAESAELSTTSAGLNAFNVPSGTTLTASAEYWVGIWANGSTDIPYLASGGTNNYTFYSRTYGSWPSGIGGRTISSKGDVGVGFVVSSGGASTDTVWVTELAGDLAGLEHGVMDGKYSLDKFNNPSELAATGDVLLRNDSLYVMNDTTGYLFRADGINLNNKDYITVENLNIKKSIRGIYNNGDNNIFSNNYLNINNTGIYSIGSGTQILKNTISYSDTGIYLSDGDIKFNELYNTGLQGGAGLYLAGADSVLNNSFYSSKDSNGVFVKNSSTDLVLINNSIASSIATDTLVVTTAAITSDYNSFTNSNPLRYLTTGYSNITAWQSGTSKDANSAYGAISSFGYTASSGRQLAVTTGSLNIDNGLDVGYSTDINGNELNQGSGYDIGSWEYGAQAVVLARITTLNSTSSMSTITLSWVKGTNTADSVQILYASGTETDTSSITTVLDTVTTNYYTHTGLALGTTNSYTIRYFSEGVFAPKSVIATDVTEETIADYYVRTDGSTTWSAATYGDSAVGVTMQTLEDNQSLIGTNKTVAFKNGQYHYGSLNLTGAPSGYSLDGLTLTSYGLGTQAKIGLYTDLPGWSDDDSWIDPIYDADGASWAIAPARMAITGSLSMSSFGITKLWLDDQAYPPAVNREILKVDPDYYISEGWVEYIGGVAVENNGRAPENIADSAWANPNNSIYRWKGKQYSYDISDSIRVWTPDSTKPSVYYTSIKQSAYDSTVASAFYSRAIELKYINSLTITDLTVEGGNYATIMLEHCDSATITNIIAQKTQNAGIRLFTSNDCHIHHNNVYGVSNMAGDKYWMGYPTHNIDIDYDSDNNIVEYNNIYDYTTGGVRMLGNADGAPDSTIVRYNLFYNHKGVYARAFASSSISTSTYPPTHSKIVGNTFVNFTNGSYLGYNDIVAYNVFVGGTDLFTYGDWVVDHNSLQTSDDGYAFSWGNGTISNSSSYTARIFNNTFLDIPVLIFKHNPYEKWMFANNLLLNTNQNGLGNGIDFTITESWLSFDIQNNYHFNSDFPSDQIYFDQTTGADDYYTWSEFEGQVSSAGNSNVASGNTISGESTIGSVINTTDYSVISNELYDAGIDVRAYLPSWFLYDINGNDVVVEYPNLGAINNK